MVQQFWNFLMYLAQISDGDTFLDNAHKTKTGKVTFYSVLTLE